MAQDNRLQAILKIDSLHHRYSVNTVYDKRLLFQGEYAGENVSVAVKAAHKEAERRGYCIVVELCN